MFTVTDSCDKLQIGNSNLRHVTDPELTMQAQQQNCAVDNVKWHFACCILPLRI